MRKELIGMSKFISMVLRHKPATIGITLDGEGWVDVQELIDNASIYQSDKGMEALTKDLLDEIIDTNEKRRFEYSEDGWRIRARQGHSVDVELGYAAITPPKSLYHGTASRFVPSIRANGIDKRKRHHVHLSKDHDTAVKVGQRHGKPHVLRVDTETMSKDGYKFFETDNNVWLVDNIPAKYIDFNWDSQIVKGAKS
jgi:putative RNA 2'-phosphotransferase